MNSLRVRLAVTGVVACLGAGGVAMATVKDDRAEVSVATVRQTPDLMAPTVPEAPVTMEGVRDRLDCPDPPDPNGTAPNPPGPGNLVYANYDYAPGNGEPSPEAAVELFASSTWPGLDPATFVATARSPVDVRYENRHAALLVSGAEGGVWVVSNAIYCGTIATEWREGRR